MSERADLPAVDDDTRPYWEACADGRLLVQWCGACGRPHHYPRPFCPHCWSDDLEWRPSSGRGRLHTWSVVFRNDAFPFSTRVPYVPALVDLDEGVRMMTAIVDASPDDLMVDMPVEVVFEPLTDGIAAPMFRPVRKLP